MKLDFLKAYDRLNWNFLQSVLAAFGFSDVWIDLIMRTMKGCHFSVLVNGLSHGFFAFEHGLRQGDPLSPALFILASEYFTKGLSKLFSDNPSLSYLTNYSMSISHLAYADDCIVFCNGQKQGLILINTFLKHYEAVSEQKINVAKSNIFLARELILM